MTQQAAAKILHIPRSTRSHLLRGSITRIRDVHRIRELKFIGIDEMSYCKGHKYATVIYDVDRFRVVWIGQGKGRDTIVDEREALKGLWWLLFKHSSNRSKKDTQTLNALRKGNHRIHRGWVLKDEFGPFCGYKAPWGAERFLTNWMTSALKRRLEPMRRFVQTFKNHMTRIRTLVESRLTNAKSEGLNRIIRIVKSGASVFLSIRAFIDRNFLTVGELDSPAQIPVKFRVIWICPKANIT